MMSSDYYGSFYDPRFRHSYMSQKAWTVTGPIFETPLSVLPCHPDMGALLITHMPQEAVACNSTATPLGVIAATESKGAK